METIVGFLAHSAGLPIAALLSNCPLTTDLSGEYAGSRLVCAPTLGGRACPVRLGTDKGRGNP